MFSCDAAFGNTDEMRCGAVVCHEIEPVELRWRVLVVSLHEITVLQTGVARGQSPVVDAHRPWQ